jgi:hypothetical protein
VAKMQRKVVDKVHPVFEQELDETGTHRDLLNQAVVLEPVEGNVQEEKIEEEIDEIAMEK